jgi:hypothetical protein
LESELAKTDSEVTETLVYFKQCIQHMGSWLIPHSDFEHFGFNPPRMMSPEYSQLFIKRKVCSNGPEILRALEHFRA